MKSLIALIAILLTGLVPVKAVVISNPTNSEYDNLVATSTISWKLTAEAGFSSGSTNELTLQSNITQSVSHNWSSPDPVIGSYDAGAGNLNFQVGSTVLLPQQPITGFNAILIRVSDRTAYDATSLNGGVLNSVSFRDLLADNNEQPSSYYDQVLITDFGNSFSFNANFLKGEFAGGDESTFQIIGLNIPEPSSFLLIGFSAVLLLSFRRREFQTTSTC